MSHPTINTLHTPITRNLAELKKGESATILGLADDDNEDTAFITARLQAFGFLPGERILVHAEAFPGKDPMAVRIGNAIFAIRRHEAVKVYITQNDQ